MGQGERGGRGGAWGLVVLGGGSWGVSRLDKGRDMMFSLRRLKRSRGATGWRSGLSVVEGVLGLLCVSHGRPRRDEQAAQRPAGGVGRGPAIDR